MCYNIAVASSYLLFRWMCWGAQCWGGFLADSGPPPTGRGWQSWARVSLLHSDPLQHGELGVWMALLIAYKSYDLISIQTIFRHWGVCRNLKPLLREIGHWELEIVLNHGCVLCHSMLNWLIGLCWNTYWVAFALSYRDVKWNGKVGYFLTYREQHVYRYIDENSQHLKDNFDFMVKILDTTQKRGSFGQTKL